MMTLTQIPRIVRIISQLQALFIVSILYLVFCISIDSKLAHEFIEYLIKIED